MSFLAPSSPFDRPFVLYLILTQPLKTLIRLLDITFSLLRPHRSLTSTHPLRIVCLSDTHCLKPKTPIPNGDILIHAGDLTNAGTPTELQAQINWLSSLPHTYKIAIAGNHDTYLDPRSRTTLPPSDQKDTIDWKGIKYLQHSSTTLHFPKDKGGGRTLRIYGAPQIPACGGPEFAFQYPRGVNDAWKDTVPEDTDVLVTHSPPKWHLDLPVGMGCEFLLREVWRVRPMVHVFGHVHAGRSDWVGRVTGAREVVRWDEGQKVLERAMAREDGGLVGQVLSWRSWWDLGLVVYYGVVGVLWERVWGGEGLRGTVMVNAALMFENEGRLGNDPQVVDV